MKKLRLGLISIGMVLMPTWAQAAFVSGSTGADGAFSPTVSTQVVLPPSGILNYTTVNIPAGINVWFKKNATNTPVVILASGNVTIAGTIYVHGSAGAASGAADNGVLSDDGTPGVGGPGGYEGGRGGMGTLTATAAGSGGVGLGPGGGSGASPNCLHKDYWGGWNWHCWGGAGGGFGLVGGAAQGGLPGGAAYGNSQLQPLIGGSGGGGGAGMVYNGGGGGGGGGAILIASSGTVSITGAIYAKGGEGGTIAGVNGGGPGGGGAGGAIRIVATTISGNGGLEARGGNPGGESTVGNSAGGSGGAGRIRLEAEAFTRTSGSEPAYTQGLPGPVFVSGLPTLRIDSVGGFAVPVEPTGKADVTLPSTTANPVTVVFTTTGVPAGNAIKLTLKPETGAAVSATSPALVGDATSATASVNITLPTGSSTMQATVTYNLTLAMGDAMSVFAQGERVAKITVESTMGAKESTVTLITVSGKEFVVPAGVLAAMPV